MQLCDLYKRKAEVVRRARAKFTVLSLHEYDAGIKVDVSKARQRHNDDVGPASDLCAVNG